MKKWIFAAILLLGVATAFSSCDILLGTTTTTNNSNNGSNTTNRNTNNNTKDRTNSCTNSCTNSYNSCKTSNSKYQNR